MKIALAQINPTVGDLRGNSAKIRQWVARAEKQGAEVILFPELSLTGYPPRDLLESNRFIEANLKELQALKALKTKAAFVIGFADRPTDKKSKKLHNAAAFIHAGRMDVRHKTLLPTYDVFDEARHFIPGKKVEVIRALGQRFALTLCEDMWNDAKFWKHRNYTADPVELLAKQKPDLYLNISSSPFHRMKSHTRLEMVRSHVRKVKRPFVFVNQVGGNDELIFDGSSFVLDAKGRVLAQAKSFHEDLLVVDLESAHAREWVGQEDVADIHDALVLGIGDYVRKCGFPGVLLGLSGGIDSAVTAALAVQALGPDKVLGVSMPGRYSSEGSVSDALLLSKNLGIKCISIPIEGPFKAYLQALDASFAGLAPDVTEENLQARIRGTLLMALSNKLRKLLLTTGNKSELSMGYCTLYGDMNGGLAAISDVPKTVVYALARHINKTHPVIPPASISKPPSAELRPNQTDQDSLPPYEVLDAIVEAYIEDGLDVMEIAALGYPAELVARILRTVDRNEYKRRQAAPGLRITPKAFGQGRRMPIARGDFR
jgi:NAD+ synthase (glutamine-hydrolysing)